MPRFCELLSRAHYPSGKAAARIAADNARMHRFMGKGRWRQVRKTARYTDYVLDLAHPFKADRGGRMALKAKPKAQQRPAAKPKPTARASPAAPRRDGVAALMQAKLTVNAPGDVYEQEADSVAARIMQMPEQQAKSKRKKPGPDSGGGVQRQATSGLQAKCATCEDQDRPKDDANAPSLQREEDEEAMAAPLQREAEEEEELQAAPLQRESEDEEEIQAAPLQRESEEEDVQAAPLQRESEEEDVQAAPLQRESEEEEAQAAPLQRESEEEEAQAAPLQRESEEEEAQAAPLQREDDEEDVQTAAQPGARRRRMSSGFEHRLHHLKSAGGSPLAPGLRSFMESRFGHSFAHVRVHTSMQARALSQEARARAFTVGRHIVFNRGQYSPDTDAGRRLLAHELTHVLQQQGGLHRVQREVFGPEADSQTTSPRDDALARHLERLVGSASGQLPKAIGTIVAEILRMAAHGPGAEELRALLADGATAAETRRVIETPDYTLRLTVLRNDRGARTEWELLRAGERDAIYHHLEQTSASAALPDGDVDEGHVPVTSPLPPRYRSDPNVNPMVTQRPTPIESAPAPSQSASQGSTPTQVSGPDTSALDAADAPKAQATTSQTSGGRGDSAGTDAPEASRPPVDEVEEEPISEESPPDVQRFARSSAQVPVTAEAESAVEQVLSSPGAPLPAELARDMGEMLGHDFDGTRIHHGPNAVRAAARVGARAFAARGHVVFGQGTFQPQTRAGRALIAHELTHVRQYHQGRGAGLIKRDEECPPPEPVPEVEVVPSPTSASEDPAFTSMERRSENRAANQAQHESGENKSNAANDAAPVTEGENRTHAQTDQVATMETEAANPPAFDREGFIQSVLDEVERIAPEVLNDVMEFSSRVRPPRSNGPLTARRKARPRTRATL
ncbi:DUF4157 domain-containing protein [Tateyamaria armeniaca]|uniref:DUF4157 domain-containing protein n=1 Tax=Tateyamaria armeniaca TaxID=2518930 RepID=A0ABW8UWR1_9RHOB